MRHRNALPQLQSDRLFMADGGLETSLIFHHGIDLPCFAAFDVLRTDHGRAALRSYFDPYLRIAGDHRLGLIVDTTTWRANRDWGAQLGYSTEDLDRANRAAVAFAEDVRDAAEDAGAGPVVISGAIGPRDDGYRPQATMTAEQAERYHAEQIATFAESAVDMVSAYTMTYADEAVGIVRAATAAEIPAVIAFTVETDGRLPTGQALAQAIEEVDARTEGAAAYFMINCAHPTHFADALEDEGAWLDRIGGLRANASRRSHAELDEADQLDDGDPVELGAQYHALRSRLRAANVVGGCCGTDHRHVEAICAAWPA